MSARFHYCARLTRGLAAFLPVLGLGAALAAPAEATDTPSFSASDLKIAASLRDSTLAGSEAYRIVESLTTEVGPRLSGSAGDRAAVAWAQKKLIELGLTHVHAQPVTVPHWVRGEASVTLAGTPSRALVTAALGGSVATPDEGLSAEVVRFADLDALKAAPMHSLDGRIAYVGKVMPRARDGHGYGEGVGARVDGPSVASARGAIGFLLRSVGTDHARIAHTGITEYAPDVVPIPAVALSNPDAELLDRRIAGGEHVLVNLRVTARSLPEAQSANVIGEITGSEHPEQVVVLGAHLDSWDLGQGAIDDGAGVAIVSAAARSIIASGHVPRRTIRIVLFAHEEGGGAGAKAYELSTRGAPEQHYAGLEADSGSGRVWRLKSSVAPAAEPAVAQLLKVLAPLGVANAGGGAHGGADVGPLNARGVPVIDLGQDSSLYFDVHHTASDTLAEIDEKDLNQAVAAFTATAWLLGNAQGSFGPVATRPSAEH